MTECYYEHTKCSDLLRYNTRTRQVMKLPAFAAGPVRLPAEGVDGSALFR